MKRSLRLTLSFVLVLLALCSCSPTQKAAVRTATPAESQSAGSQPAGSQPVSLSEQLVMANLWLQTSAEYRALCYQAFQLARERLDEAVAGYQGERPLAVVVDCDETVIATNRYGAWMITSKEQYSDETWGQWMREDQAHEVAGAGAFLRYAAAMGVEVFYITNRYEKNNDATLAQLKSLGFPNADAAHLLARTDNKDKTLRRQQVGQSHEVVLLLGDSLADYDAAFRGGDAAARAALVDSRAEQLCQRFIILPNPTYGEWEQVLYDGERLSDTAKAARRRSSLDPWQPE